MAQAVAQGHWALGSVGVGLSTIALQVPDVSFRTLQRDLRRLCDLGVLERVGDKRGASYRVVGAPPDWLDAPHAAPRFGR
jgi:hypothetical protein